MTRLFFFFFYAVAGERHPFFLSFLRWKPTHLKTGVVNLLLEFNIWLHFHLSQTSKMLYSVFDSGSLSVQRDCKMGFSLGHRVS